MTRLVEATTSRVIAKEIERATDDILAKYGFTRTKATHNYGDYFGIKIQAVPIGADTPQATDWKRYAALFDLPEDAMGKTITMSGKTFKIVGLNTRARRMPVMLEEVATGKSFKAPAESVNLYLNR